MTINDPTDHHLLDLYRAALASRGAGERARRAVEAYRAKRREQAGFDGWQHVGCSCDGCREDARLCEAAALAEQRETAAKEALIDAFYGASWGEQPDGSFVTIRSIGVASGHYEHALHAPGRGGPLVEVSNGCIDGLRTFEEARAMREAARALNRARGEVYDVARRAAGSSLRSGVALSYRTGKEWGSVEVPFADDVAAGIATAADAIRAGAALPDAMRMAADWSSLAAKHVQVATAVHGPYDGPADVADRLVSYAASPQRVSAVGALRAAGLSRENAEKLLSDEWKRLELEWDHSETLRLSVHGIERLERAEAPVAGMGW